MSVSVRTGREQAATPGESRAAVAGRHGESGGQHAGPDPGSGLVLCAITGRISDAGPAPGQIADLWTREFSGRERVSAAAGMFGRPVLAGNADVPSFAIVVAPGVLRMAGTDLEQSYWADRRAIESRRSVRDHKTRGEVTSWTRKSRAKMAMTLAALDWSYLRDATGLPAMVTLTYPADWVTVAPTGRVVKDHLKVLRKRWERAWGGPPKCAWKLEFQRRGAPHIHIGPIDVPLGRAERGRRRAVGDGLPFNRWLSVVWADIVNHPDPAERQRHELAGTNVDYKQGMRCADPKRLAVYFSKHGAWQTKEYQNSVPDEWKGEGKGPGRFWGYWGLEPCRVMVELGKQEHLLLSRTLRHMSERSHVWNSEQRRTEVVPATREVTVTRHRVNPLTGEVSVRRRKVRRRVKRLKYHRGFVCVNDGPALAAVLARLIEGKGRYG